MKSDKDHIRELAFLTLLSVEGNIDREKFDRLENLIVKDVRYRNYYMSLINIYIGLNNPQTISSIEGDEDVCLDDDVLRLLAKCEEVAPEVKDYQAEKTSNTTTNEVSEIEPVKSNKFFRIYSKLISIAAVFMFVFIVYVHIFPPKFSVGIATVQDQIDVVWKHGSEKLTNKDMVLNNQLPYQIEKGIIEVQYDNGVHVVIEGPAKFQFESSGVILEFGTLYSSVTDSGVGFQVVTPNCRFIDLGTEFGIKADADGSSEMHVVKGKVHMNAGNGKYSKTIYEASASRYNADTGQMKDVCYNSKKFVRNIESKNNRVWRGEKTINLADIVGGGNGFGTGQYEYGIDPGTGIEFFLRPEHIQDVLNASNDYHLCQENPYIDGVFVPNAADGMQIVTSRGHTYLQCPQTNGNYFGRIINGTAKSICDDGRGLFLNSVYYGTAQNPAIFMHTNQGVTFDLDRIRHTVDSTEVIAFASVCGISESGPDYGFADVTVLVDGRVRYNQKNIVKAQSFQIEVALNSNDRFLTLLTTVSIEKKVPKDDNGNLNLEHGDWCFFGNPVLKLK